jgi:adenylate kinase family enzyme
MERNWGRERIKIGRRIIAFIGPEGSGKTENAKLLSAASGKLYIGTSPLLHFLADNDPGYIGEAARKMFNDKVYFPGKLMLKVVGDRFSKEDTLNGIIVDGCFRTFEETVNFEETLIRVGRNFPLTVIYLNIPKEMCIERARARNRKDDTPEGLESRLAEFYFQLEERLNVMKNNPNWNFIEIDATPPLATVFGRVCEAVSPT